MTRRRNREPLRRVGASSLRRVGARTLRRVGARTLRGSVQVGFGVGASRIRVGARTCGGSVRNFVCVWALWESAFCAVVQVPVGAFSASAGTAVSTRAFILRVRRREAPFVQDRKLRHRGRPVNRAALPFGGDVAEGEPNQLRRRLVRRKVTTGLDNLPQLRMHALERVRRVDDTPDIWRKGEERDDVGPRAAPRSGCPGSRAF
jgi:hypothetical protein